MKNKMTCFRRIVPLALSFILMAGTALAVHGESYTGSPGHTVTLTSDGKMISDFSSGSIADDISKLYPGDDVTVTVTLKNESGAAADWYMKNSVISSMEDTGVASGGAYTYVLTYSSPDGTQTPLYDSDTVGGEGAVKTGLYGASSTLEDYFLLDTIGAGKDSVITLKVAFDPESQGNYYQDMSAELNMQFAVETDTSGTGTDNGTGNTGNGAEDTDSGEAPDTVIMEDAAVPTSDADNISTDVVETGDESDIYPFLIAAAVSGALLLFIAIWGVRERHKRQKGGAVT